MSKRICEIVVPDIGAWIAGERPRASLTVGFTFSEELVGDHVFRSTTSASAFSDVTCGKISIGLHLLGKHLSTGFGHDVAPISNSICGGITIWIS